MTLPDKLTISRIFLTFLFIYFVVAAGLTAKITALVIFLAASFTDFLDGFIAKGRNICTDFGRLMDPIADKVLVLGAFITFVGMELVPAWMVVVIVFREAAITGLRLFALTKGKVIAADFGGRHKMVSQVFTIFAILIFIIFREAGIKIFRFWSQDTESVYRDTIFFLMLTTVILTVISGVSYLVRNKEVYSNAKTD